jgi:cyanophycinase
MPRKFWIGWILALGALIAPATANATPEGYTRYLTGDRLAPTPGPRDAGLLLSGGGEWDVDAFRWFAAKAGHGHLVVLRASLGPEIGEDFMKRIGGVASVETFVFDDRKAAYDPLILSALAKADGIFIAGGDQSRYVRFWQATPLSALLDRLAKDHPIGGTSAGLAIMGWTGYGAFGDGIASPEALANPVGPAVTIVGDFLHLPHMRRIFTDSHFMIRDRMGRLIAFLAKLRHDGGSRGGARQIVGLGIDERASLVVEPDGQARLMAPAGTYAWLVEPSGPPQRATLGQPLDYASVRITAIGTASRLDLVKLKVSEPAFAGTAQVRNGQLSGVPVSSKRP